MEFLSLTWGWFDKNASQLQVLIILSFFVLAWLIYIYIYERTAKKKKIENLKRCEIKHQTLRVSQEYLDILLELKTLLPEAYDAVYKKLLACEDGISSEKYKIALKLLFTYESKQKQVEEYYQMLMKNIDNDFVCLTTLENHSLKYILHAKYNFVTYKN